MNWSAFLQCVLLIAIGAGAAAAFFRWSNRIYFDASGIMSGLNDRMIKMVDKSNTRAEDAYDRAVEMMNAQAMRIAAYEDRMTEQERQFSAQEATAPGVVETIVAQEAARRSLNRRATAGGDGTGKVNGNSRLDRAVNDVREFEEALKAGKIRAEALAKAEAEGIALVDPQDI